MDRSDATGLDQRQRLVDPAARHRLAVARSLASADEAARHGDYADAIAWVDLVEALGEGLPTEYDAKRRRWEIHLARPGAAKPRPWPAA